MRSKYKLPFLGKTLFYYIYKGKNINLNFYTRKRCIYLFEFLLDFNFHIHNGLKHYLFQPSNNKLNRKLGEFVFTRKIFKYKRKKRK
jgi:ribosomal protein S19